MGEPMLVSALSWISSFMGIFRRAEHLLASILSPQRPWSVVTGSRCLVAGASPRSKCVSHTTVMHPGVPFVRDPFRCVSNE